MLRVFILMAVLFSFSNPAEAAYYHRSPGRPDDGGIPNPGFPTNGADRPNNLGGARGNSNTLLYAAGGVLFVGAMWYLFRTPRSSQFDNQVVIRAF